MSQQQAKLLVVDDDPDVCDTMQVILESYGYHVDIAEHGMDALHKLRSGDPPSVILLDMMMPDMDGLQFRQEQLRDPKLAKIPVVLVSASGEVATKAAALGVTGLTKPIDLDVLLATLKSITAAGPAAS